MRFDRRVIASRRVAFAAEETEAWPRSLRPEPRVPREWSAARIRHSRRENHLRREKTLWVVKIDIPVACSVRPSYHRDIALDFAGSKRRVTTSRIRQVREGRAAYLAREASNTIDDGFSLLGQDACLREGP